MCRLAGCLQGESRFDAVVLGQWCQRGVDGRVGRDENNGMVAVKQCSQSDNISEDKDKYVEGWRSQECKVREWAESKTLLHAKSRVNRLGNLE
jgi:hypothetical protein